MLIAKIAVTGVRAASTKLGTLTSGMVGAKVQFFFDSGWEGLNKTAVFRCMDITKDVLNIDSEVTIPHEVLVRSGSPLYAGVYGTNADGDLVIPTRWATVGIVYSGADPSGDTSADPSLPIWLDAIRGRKVAEVGQTIVVKAVDENGKPTEWEAAELPAEADQPDWAAAEGEPGHVLNRPFYEEAADKTMFDGTINASGYVFLGAVASFADNSCELIVGNTYKVVFDGIAYSCVAVSGYNGGAALGNNAYAGDYYIPDAKDDVPFLIVGGWSKNGINGFDFNCETAGQHSLVISEESTAVHQLDPKYIPTPDWNAKEGEAGHILNRPFYEELQVIAESEVTDSTHQQLPEATYEVGKSYIVEVNGEQKTFEFVAVTTMYNYCVGFNIKGAQWDAPILDSSVGYRLTATVGRVSSDSLPSGLVTAHLQFIPQSNIYPAHVRILEVEAKIKTIDPKYLPNTGGAMIVTVTTVDGTPTADKTYADVKAAVENGRIVRLHDVDAMQYFDLSFMSGAMAKFTAVQLSFGAMTYTEWNMYEYMTDINKVTETITTS